MSQQDEVIARLTQELRAREAEVAKLRASNERLATTLGHERVEREALRGDILGLEHELARIDGLRDLNARSSRAWKRLAKRLYASERALSDECDAKHAKLVSVADKLRDARERRGQRVSGLSHQTNPSRGRSGAERWEVMPTPKLRVTDDYGDGGFGGDWAIAVLDDDGFHSGEYLGECGTDLPLAVQAATPFAQHLKPVLIFQSKKMAQKACAAARAALKGGE